jgi:hypothetical protein
MKRVWTEEELEPNWLLLPGELEIIRERQGVSRLGFVVCGWVSERQELAMPRRWKHG